MATLAELLVAFALTAVLAATPAVVFLLFWRFLVALRDDALVETLVATHDLDPPAFTPEAVLGPRAGTEAESPTFARCPRCGSRAGEDGQGCLACDERRDA